MEDHNYFDYNTSLSQVIDFICTARQRFIQFESAVQKFLGFCIGHRGSTLFSLLAPSSYCLAIELNHSDELFQSWLYANGDL